MDKFILHSPYKPTGDQPEAIEKIVAGINRGDKEQTLLGVTGSGKTFTMANIIERVNRPTLVLAHNKTLAAQLCSEFREFFPENAVEYLKSKGFVTAALALKDNSININNPVLKESEKLALFLGAEGEGLSNSTIDSCDYTVKIPMYHDVDSLNVAAAAAVSFWEIMSE